MGQKVYFTNSKRDKLCGILSNPSKNVNKPIIILCHGFHSNKNRKSYALLSDILNKYKISTFRFDFFGHGESEGKFEDITISEAVDDILQAINFLKQKGYSKIGLFGSSFGGMASIMTASKSNDLFLLALRSPVSNYEKYYKKKFSLSYLDDWKRKGYRYYKEDGKKLRLNYSFLEDFKNNDGWKASTLIKIPTLIIHGDKDKSVPVEQSIKTTKLIPNCRLVLIKGADHRYTNEKHFQRMLKSISDFIIKRSK